MVVVAVAAVVVLAAARMVMVAMSSCCRRSEVNHGHPPTTTTTTTPPPHTPSPRISPFILPSQHNNHRRHGTLYTLTLVPLQGLGVLLRERRHRSRVLLPLPLHLLALELAVVHALALQPLLGAVQLVDLRALPVNQLLLRHPRVLQVAHLSWWWWWWW